MHYRVRFSAVDVSLLARAEPGAKYQHIEEVGDGAFDIDLSHARMHSLIRRLRLAADRGGKVRGKFLVLADALDGMVKQRGANPVPASRRLRAGGSHQSDPGHLGDAKRLYEDFSGNTAGKVLKADVAHSDAYLQVGKIDAILYTTNREGRIEHYRHDFSRMSRPLLIASHDGKELRMIGGSFRFTARGIVDHDSAGDPLE